MQIITTNAPQAAPAVKGVPAATGILRAGFRQAIAACEAVRARHRTAKDHADKAEALLCVAGERAERRSPTLESRNTTARLATPATAPARSE